MTEIASAKAAEKYLNPVYPHSFPDPFVLKFRGEYFAYCTDIWHDGRVFGVLRSRDLVNWTEIGGAMQKLDNDAPFYWAPEVTYSNGKFYLYYSVGNEKLMEIRVAVSNRPDGGFVDSGVKLTTQDFAIDAHVFVDDSGEKYMFYATDFLDYAQIGTGTVVDKMIDFFTLEGNPRPVTRAKYDWQIYDSNRIEKGGVRWHTVEGPFVIKRKGIYYEMFSGGNWQNISYGVSFAVTDDLEQTDEWTQFADGEKVFPILRTVPDLVVGPGHNSVIRGANNRELYCVYHRWTNNQRTLSIDRQDFADTRIFIEGASFAPQIMPFAPKFADFFDGESLNKNWRATGEWKISDNETLNNPSESSELICSQTAEQFLCEFSFRAVRTTNENGCLGFYLQGETEINFEFLMFPQILKVEIVWFENGHAGKQIFDLPEGFDFSVIHLLRVEVDGFRIRVALDEAALKFERTTEKFSEQIAFVVENAQAAFSGFSLTEGFEDLFDWHDEITQHGWKKLTEEGTCYAENGQLLLSIEDKNEAVIMKGKTEANFEFAANVSLIENFDETASFGFLFLNENGEEVKRFSFSGAAGNYTFSDEKNILKFALPENFTPESCHQFRFLRFGENVCFQLEGIDLCEFQVALIPLQIALFCRRATVAYEMARLTVL